MSIPRGKCLLTILVLLIVAALAAPPLTQIAAPPAEPNRAARRPDTPIKLYNGAPVQFTLNQFEATADPKKKMIQTDPFTAAELIAVAGDKMKKHGDKLFVTTNMKFTKGTHTVSVPLDDYVKQLNGYEAFLNRYGYTLRDGPLRKKANPTPLDALFVKNQDFGVILKLVDKTEIKPSGPGGKVELPKDQVRVMPGEDVYGSRVFGVNPALRGTAIDKTGGRNNSRLRFKRIALARDPLSRRGRFVKVQDTFDGEPPCGEKPDPKEGPVGGKKGLCFDDEGKDIDCPPAGPPIKTDTEVVTAPCLPPKEPSITCLYEGELTPKPWSPISLCKGGSAGGWFGATLCMDVVASVNQKGAVMNLLNEGNAQLGAVLFGQSLTILQAGSDAFYNSDQNPNHGFTPAKITIPLANNLEIESDFSQSFEGPGAVFPIGPVPITVTSKLNAKFGLDKTAPLFNQPPLACSMPGTGQLDMNLKVNAFAGVELKAGLDVFVAAAGIEADLNLVDFDFGTKMSSIINPSANEVRLKPSAGWNGTMMAGHINLFVEVDILIYSKKWSVELFRFDGFKWPGEGAPGTVFVPDQVLYSTKAQGLAQ